MKNFLFVIFVAFFISSCSTSKKVTESFKDPSIDTDKFKSSKLLVYGTSEIVTNTVSEAYNEVFDTVNFNSYLYDKFDIAFAKNMPKIEVINGAGKLQKQSYRDLINHKPIDVNADYLLLLNYVIIRDSLESKGQTHGTHPGGARTGNDNSLKGSSVYAISRSEAFQVEMQVEVWQLEGTKKILNFTSEGYQKILLSENDALEEAIDKSISAAVEYINNM